jgi:hypothetical protein
VLLNNAHEGWENDAGLPNEEESPIGVCDLTQFEPLLDRAVGFKRFLARLAKQAKAIGC